MAVGRQTDYEVLYNSRSPRGPWPVCRRGLQAGPPRFHYAWFGPGSSAILHLLTRLTGI